METAIQLNEIESRATQMLGHYFMYQNKRLKVESYRMATSKIIVHTDVLNIPIDYVDFETEAAKFISIDSTVKDLTEPEQSTSSVAKSFNTPSVIVDNYEALSTLMMQNISKIKEDKAFIPQASAINEQVKSFIELGKTQIEMMRLQLAMSNNGKR